MGVSQGVALEPYCTYCILVIMKAFTVSTFEGDTTLSSRRFKRMRIHRKIQRLCKKIYDRINDLENQTTLISLTRNLLPHKVVFQWSWGIMRK